MKTFVNTQTKKCGNRIYKSSNCHNKFRKDAENKFERITMWGKHAFNYSVIVENKATGEIKENIFPNRKAALCFFMIAIKKYN